jgi:hypothetical protein
MTFMSFATEDSPTNANENAPTHELGLASSPVSVAPALAPASDSLTDVEQEKMATAAALCEEGASLHSKKDNDNAIEFFSKALSLYVAVVGENHPDTARTYLKMGESFHCKREFLQGLEMYEKALTGFRATFGEMHEDTAYTYYMIGNLHVDRGESCASRFVFPKAILGFYMTLGPDHRLTRSASEMMQMVSY